MVVGDNGGMGGVVIGVDGMLFPHQQLHSGSSRFSVQLDSLFLLL